MYRAEYDPKMETLLNVRETYEIVKKLPSRNMKRELNCSLLRLHNEQKLDNFTYMELRSTEGTTLGVSGSVKQHKLDCPLRSIVSCTGSSLWLTYNTSRILSDILTPLQNSNGFSVKDSTDLKNKISGALLSTKTRQYSLLIRFLLLLL